MTGNKTNEATGWAWFDPPADPPGADQSSQDPALQLAPELAPDLAKAFARCFRGGDGERALAHLRAITLERAMGPGVSDAMLRHAEGQRQLYAYMAALVARGRG